MEVAYVLRDGGVPYVRSTYAVLESCGICSIHQCVMLLVIDSPHSKGLQSKISAAFVDGHAELNTTSRMYPHLPHLPGSMSALLVSWKDGLHQSQKHCLLTLIISGQSAHLSLHDLSTQRTLFWKKLSPFCSLKTSPPSGPDILLTSLILTGPVAAHVTDACTK